MNDDRLIEDTLFLACTRPAMVASVPIEAVGINIMITGFCFLAGNNLLYLLVGPVLHFIFRLIVKNDHNQFRVLAVWLDTKMRCRNAGLWGGSSITPLKTVRRYSVRDLDHG